MSGPMPIDQAMQKLSTQGRMAASPDIVPSASKDVAALQGWLKMPHDVPPAMSAPVAPPLMAAAGPDAGAMAPAAAADGGAPKPTGPRKPTAPNKKKP